MEAIEEWNKIWSCFSIPLEPGCRLGIPVLYPSAAEIKFTTPTPAPTPNWGTGQWVKVSEGSERIWFFTKEFAEEVATVGADNYSKEDWVRLWALGGKVTTSAEGIKFYVLEEEELPQDTVLYVQNSSGERGWVLGSMVEKCEAPVSGKDLTW